MAKSSRASRVKKNNSALKKKVFGPVETARMERQNAKLLALAQQPKPPRPEMDVEEEPAKQDEKSAEDNDVMQDADADGEAAKTRAVRSNTELKKARASKIAKVDKHRHRRAKNAIAFAKHPKKGKKAGKA